MTARKSATKSATKTAKVETKKSDKRIYESRGRSVPLPAKDGNAKKAETGWENPTIFEILEDVPIPWTRVNVRDIVFPFEGMGVGHCFRFMRETNKGQNVYSAFVSYCRQPEHFHKRFVTRKISEEVLKGIEWTTWGCWREDDLTEAELAAKRKVIEEKQKLATIRRHARGK